MKFKDNMIWVVIKYSAFWLGAFYIIWLLRFVEDGELITGAIMAACFGGGLVYFFEALVNWKKYKDKLQTILGFLISYWIFSIWYTLLKHLGAWYADGTPLPVMDPKFRGWFGIEGFWGLGIIIPVYIGIILSITLIFSIAEKYWWEIKHPIRAYRGWKYTRQYVKMRKEVGGDSLNET